MTNRLPSRTRQPLLAGVIALLGASTLSAQASLTPAPRASIQMRGGVSRLSAWPGASVTVDRDAWVAAFAVTRGSRTLPVQVLSPIKPGKAGWVKAGAKVPLRQVANGEALHLVNYGEAPVVVVFASSQRPDLSAFADGARWAPDVMLGNAVMSQEEMVELLGSTIFGYSAEYSVAVSNAAEPKPITRTASNWVFGVGCDEVIAYERSLSPNGRSILVASSNIDPLIRNQLGQTTPQAQLLRESNNVPAELKGGIRATVERAQRVSPTACRGYQVAWWPKIDRPMPVDSLGRGSLVGEPRYPDVSAPVGSVPGQRATTAEGQFTRDASTGSTAPVTGPRIILDPREIANDPQARRSMQGVSKPGGSF